LLALFFSSTPIIYEWLFSGSLVFGESLADRFAGSVAIFAVCCIAIFIYWLEQKVTNGL
jgi:hypothetical protein